MNQPKKTNKETLQLILRIFMILIVIKLAIGAVFLWTFLTKEKKLTPKFCYQEQCIELEVARTPEERAIGLMNREVLAEDKGMLFEFEQAAQQSFWMKNTLIPLDIFWLDEENKLLEIQQMEPCVQEPCPSYVPEHDAIRAIEVNSWVVEKLGLKVGEVIELR